MISSICVYIVLVIVWSGLEPQVCTSHCQWEGTVGKSPIVKQFTRTVKTSTKPTGFDLIKKSKLDAKVTSIIWIFYRFLPRKSLKQRKTYFLSKSKQNACLGIIFYHHWICFFYIITELACFISPLNLRTFECKISRLQNMWV